MDRLEAIHIFIRVAELASFTQAADSLGLPKASISGAVKQLENLVGAQLLHRTTRRVQLTQDGHSFYQRSKDLLADVDDPGRGAAQFQDTLAAALAEWVSAAAEREKMDTVALGGGCFLNRLLAADVQTRLVAAGLNVLEARQVPPNDGGLSLGQAWVALHTE